MHNAQRKLIMNNEEERKLKKPLAGLVYTKIFPSHLIIGKDGKIKKFTLQYAEIEKQLKTLQ